ncbi:MAG: carbon-nitrogen family hydrolase [Actinobacteria bacterium]|uniref:Unannotated protein n=1 Tax=freshwater metagenome TaxID=449393 RepID=A0A6J7S6W1_9ZZZZ|nr:carbon-nitrogen family hydrolase [Actinomycetota bacterium]
MQVCVALIQLEVADRESVAARERRVLQMIDAAALQADVVVLPELWHVGAFNYPAVREHSELMSGQLVSAMRESAIRNGIWLHAGSFAERTEKGEIYNTSVVFDPNGELIAQYRKIHLFGFGEGESEVFAHGEAICVAETILGGTGLATCYDLRFPEIFRMLTERGATCVVIASGWPLARVTAWDVLTRARAIENQAWVLACNEVGSQGGVVLGGHSQIVNPQGEVVASADEVECILYATIDPDLAHTVREEFPVLKDIRIEGAFTS